ncbi:hypothetical protein BGY98DRAFT_144186 [Russula aff. rugulosa BPL654]|nr:hypothetical protein BGY98DRAFT_144186 [Russula aff. rugulosa BPL654]
MTEYDYSPEAYERYMATQTRISNWANKVSQSMEMPSPAIPQQSPEQYPPRSRPSYSQPHSQTHSRSNSASRSHTRGLPHYHREHTSYRPRSHSQSSSRPHATRSYTFAQPIHSRTYSYALHQPPPPVPIHLPQPVPFLNPVPRRSQTLPTQPHQVVYHTYDAPRGGPHTSWVHPPWEVFIHRYGCTTQSRRPNVPNNRCSSACSRASDPGGFPLRAPRQNPSTHLQGGTGGGVASELTVLIRLAPVRHRLFILS